MCKKLRFISDIGNKQIKDFQDYGLRLRRLYIIFGIIGIIDVFTTYAKHDSVEVQSALQIAGLVLYLGIIYLLSQLSDKTVHDTSLRSTVVHLIVLLMANTAVSLTVFIYLLLYYYSWTVFFSLFSLVLQVAGIYIFFYFKSKIDEEMDAASGHYVGSENDNIPIVQAFPVDSSHV
jgi:hypothetical protein